MTSDRSTTVYRRFLSSIRQMGQRLSSTAAYRPPIIRDAERLLIDSSCLYCPICLHQFTDVPIVFECGHSCCLLCTQMLITTSSIVAGQAQRYYECPLCRMRIPIMKKKTSDVVKSLTKNFVIGAIIDSVSELANDDKTPVVDANLRFENRRLTAQIVKERETIEMLKKDVEQEKASMIFWRCLSIGLLIVAFVSRFLL